MILLDTCTLLWLVLQPDRLSLSARELLRARVGHLYVSPVTAFEIGQKHSRGKLRLNILPAQWFPLALECHGLQEVAFSSAVALRAAALPDLHRDPFDRLLTATALENSFLLLTPDPLIHQYPELRWAW